MIYSYKGLILLVKVQLTNKTQWSKQHNSPYSSPGLNIWELFGVSPPRQFPWDNVTGIHRQTDTYEPVDITIFNMRKPSPNYSQMPMRLKERLFEVSRNEDCTAPLCLIPRGS